MITWRAVYRDKMCLPQFNEDGTENRYKDIDRWRLIRFDVLRDGVPFYSFYPRAGQRLIYRRRNFIRVSGNPHPKYGMQWTVYLIGWQKTFETSTGKKNITVINYIYPDGSIALDDSRNNLEILPEELM